MCPCLLAVVWLLQLAQAAPTNTTAAPSPSYDATIKTHDYRSVWSLLGSCGLTLLICVWHAIHPALPLPDKKPSKPHPRLRQWARNLLYRLALMALAFFAPEIIIAAASGEWQKAKKTTERIREDPKYEAWWTMTHSHFLINGGFALADGEGIKEIHPSSFESVMKGKTGNPMVKPDGSEDEEQLIIPPTDIVNPVVTEDQIKDKSNSDALAKAILIVQLSWFMIQIAVRLGNRLTVTLIELDTVCLALFTLPLLFFWWNKPRCAATPHIFYTRSYIDNRESQQDTDGVSGEQLLNTLTIRSHRTWGDLISPASLLGNAALVPLLLTWTVFGALHTIAWNYPFPTRIETMLWRVSSLTLAGGPLVFATMLRVLMSTSNSVVEEISGRCVMFAVSVGLQSRVLLVALMLASLRSLPPSAHLVVPWTEYIPHL